MLCSRCGAKLGTREEGGRLRSVCASCGWVVYRQLRVGAAVLVQQDGALLLLKRGAASHAFPGAWNLPSGYSEADESPAAAAMREAAEETGLQVRSGRLVNVYYFDDDPRGNGVLVVYDGTVTGGELQVDGREAVAADFFTPEQLPEPLCGGGHDQAILAWQARMQDRWQPGSPMRYCPHCAHPLEEKMAFERLRRVCPMCGFIHFRAPKVGVSLLVEEQERVLLIRRAVEPGRGKWGLPSGFIELDESPEVAAMRECEEETGLTMAGLVLVDATHYSDDYRGSGINLVYRGAVMSGELRAGDDAAEARFFARSQVPALGEIAFQGHRDLLSRWLQRDM